MSSNYTGSSTGADSPDAAPAPDTDPVIQNPSDGDALNAASILQRGKALANHISWLKKPFAKASDWAAHIIAFRNAAQHRGMGFGHQGELTGRFWQWQEGWIDLAATDKTVDGSGGWFGRWNYRVIRDGSAAQAPVFVNLGDPPTQPLGTIVGCSVGNSTDFPGAAHLSVVEMCKPLAKMPDSVAILEGAFSLNNGSPFSGFSAGWGFGGGDFVTSASTDELNTGSAVPNGSAYIYKPVGVSFWRCVSRTAGGSAITTTTGVATTGDLSRRGRIEILGSTSSDTGSAMVNFYIDGTRVATHAHSLVDSFLFPFVRATNGNAGAQRIAVGPLRFTMRLETGDKPLV